MIQSLRDQMAKREAEPSEPSGRNFGVRCRRREKATCSPRSPVCGAEPSPSSRLIAEQLPDVFAGEILPKLDMLDTLSLAQVSKRYNDAVWNVAGVRSLEAKIEARLQQRRNSWLLKPDDLGGKARQSARD